MINKTSMTKTMISIIWKDNNQNTQAFIQRRNNITDTVTEE